MSRSDRRSGMFNEDLETLIREALQDTVGDQEPPAQVWARIRAEVTADRVPLWVAWWRRLRLACADRLPRAMQSAIVFSLVVLLASMSFGRLGWPSSSMPVAGPAAPSNQRQLVLAEQRFREQYRATPQNALPTDIPPKGERRTPLPPVPAPSTSPQHLAVGAQHPS